MNGAWTILHLYAFMSWTVKTLLYLSVGLRWEPDIRGIVFLLSTGWRVLLLLGNTSTSSEVLPASCLMKRDRRSWVKLPVREAPPRMEVKNTRSYNSSPPPFQRIRLKRLTPNDPYMGRTAPLNSKRCILYIYSTNIGTEYFKHALYSPVFFSLFKMQFFS